MYKGYPHNAEPMTIKRKCPSYISRAAGSKVKEPTISRFNNGPDFRAAGEVRWNMTIVPIVSSLLDTPHSGNNMDTNPTINRETRNDGTGKGTGGGSQPE